METMGAETVMLGDWGVGKSSIVIRFTKDKFPVTQEMIRSDFFMKTVAEDNFRVSFKIFDTASQERYESLPSYYVRRADCFIIVYDITNKKSFESVEKWLEFIERACKNEPTVMAIVGNKLELEAERQVTVEEASLFAEKHSYLFMEVSAKTAANINALFSEIAKKLVSNPPSPRIDGGVKIGEAQAQAQSPPCRHSLG